MSSQLQIIYLIETKYAGYLYNVFYHFLNVTSSPFFMVLLTECLQDTCKYEKESHLIISPPVPVTAVNLNLLSVVHLRTR